ncbi:hypothetical protein BBJ28_00014197 [Nothophytophthora sp. Chile5]|nr:hypothetical protein BBJ28_00014197 [Nothophytophthora sp. Chile5]
MRRSRSRASLEDEGEGPQREDEDAEEEEEEEEGQEAEAGGGESLAQLLVDMTARVQAEREQRGLVETRNQALLRELDALQQELLALRTASCVSAASESRAEDPKAKEDVAADADAGEFCWKELLEAKKAKEKALVEAHQRAMQVLELNACVSMQHDELSALRSRAKDDREARERSESAAKELQQERQLLAQETALLRANVEQLTGEMGQRSTHFKALLEKWTEAQAQSEHRERESAALREQLQAARQRAELRERELETLRDERGALQHQANQLKGAVAARSAESKAFQAYGASAREHLQAQGAALQRHGVYRRQVNGLARDALASVRGLRATLTQTRAPLVAIQSDFRRFLERLRAPVTTLVERSARFAQAAQAEHTPLRQALQSAELARRHLHDQLWNARRNALLVCQLQNAVADGGEAETPPSGRLLRANYATGELFLRDHAAPDAADVLAVKCDAVLSDRAREWDRHESVTPLLQSLLDGRNACVATFVGASPLRMAPIAAASSSTREVAVSELLLRELFAAVDAGDTRFRRAKLTISYLAVFNEAVYDLLGLEDATPSTETRQMVVLEVQNAEEALLVLAGGREHLPTPAGLAHTVVTVCLAYERLLTDAPPVKSKLQIVELALGPGSSAGSVAKPLPWAGAAAEEVKQRVAVETGASALVTALAEVRVKDAAFVRYHSSKLTVLLQDTLKAGAKFLALVALPVSSPAVGGGGADPAAIVRVLQQMRAAVGGGGGGASPPAARDRSVEGFMNRLALQTQAESLALPFSSLDMQDAARRRREGADGNSWGSELERMTKRYGREALETLEATAPSSNRQQTAASNAVVDCGYSQLAPVHPLPHASSSCPPPPPTAVRKLKLSRRGSKPPRGLGGAPSRHRSATEASATTRKKQQQAVAILLPATKAVRSATFSRPAATTPATATRSPLAAVFKIRRETASSALKKSVLAATCHLQDKRTPFR